MEIVQDNDEDGDDNRGSLQMADVASNTSSTVTDNTEPWPTAVEIAASIQGEITSSRANNSSKDFEESVSGDDQLVTTDESQPESVDDPVITSSGM